MLCAECVSGDERGFLHFFFNSVATLKDITSALLVRRRHYNKFYELIIVISLLASHIHNEQKVVNFSKMFLCVCVSGEFLDGIVLKWMNMENMISH